MELGSRRTPPRSRLLEIRNPQEDGPEHRQPEASLLHHSDRGSQYACCDFQQLLHEHGIVCSMRRRGKCYGNAPTESFFGKLKTEWVHGEDYLTREQATQHVCNSIEPFYNRQRKHAALSYISPAPFEELYYQQSSQQAA